MLNKCVHRKKEKLFFELHTMFCLLVLLHPGVNLEIHYPDIIWKKIRKSRIRRIISKMNVDISRIDSGI